ncbi:MAG: hypothetical protein JSU79_01910 [Dehalococcoidales bacterium]|jgi:hypothetical protein|nr:MAG: hypothetical protein JSU79_01910 [Dehalococcoidales bacterium]
MAEKTYKCLNPVGIHTPVDLSPLAPRLDKLDGKTIFVSIGAGGEQDITIPLPKKLQEKYPQVNWIIQGAGPHLTKAGSISLTDEQVESGEIDALIRGVIW